MLCTNVFTTFGIKANSIQCIVLGITPILHHTVSIHSLQYAVTDDLLTLTAVAVIGQGYDFPGRMSFALRMVDGGSHAGPAAYEVPHLMWYWIINTFHTFLLGLSLLNSSDFSRFRSFSQEGQHTKY